MSEELNKPLKNSYKKIIYLDQFALSYMVRALHPKMRATGNSIADLFWVTLYEKLDKLIKMQIIICPQSSFHFQESIVSNFFEPLEKMYYHLSRGFQFIDEDQIKKLQIKESVLKWLNQSTDPKLPTFGSVNSVFNKNVNVWLPPDFIYKSSRYPSEYEAIFRESREKIHQQWIKEFYLWKEKRNIKFGQWREDFYLSLIKTILFSNRNYHKYIALLPGPSTFDIGLCNFLLKSIDAIKIIHSALEEGGRKKIELEKQTWSYLQSEYFGQIPFIKLYSLFYSSFARKAGSGQKKPPGRGITNDLNMLSVLLPYCDAMFIDNQCRACLEENDVSEQIDYKTQVFSLNNKEEFLLFLENLEDNFPLEYRQKIIKLYGEKWINTPTQLFVEKPD